MPFIPKNPKTPTKIIETAKESNRLMSSYPKRSNSSDKTKEIHGSGQTTLKLTRKDIPEMISKNEMLAQMIKYNEFRYQSIFFNLEDDEDLVRYQPSKSTSTDNSLSAIEIMHSDFSITSGIYID